MSAYSGKASGRDWRGIAGDRGATLPRQQAGSVARIAPGVGGVSLRREECCDSSAQAYHCSRTHTMRRGRASVYACVRVQYMCVQVCVCVT